jgi:hypothetical protein
LVKRSFCEIAKKSCGGGVSEEGFGSGKAHLSSLIWDIFPSFAAIAEALEALF